MKGLIIAYGENDSLGNDRLSEPRGLMKFGGKEVIKHTLDKFTQIGINGALILTHPEIREKYQRALENRSDVKILNYQGPSDPTFVYGEGLSLLGADSHILTVADDNIFTFSLEGLVNRSNEVDSSVMVVRDEEYIDDKNHAENYNFGKCLMDDEGKLIDASYSFLPKVINSKKVILDIYLVHKNHVYMLIETIKKPGITPIEILSVWENNFYGHTINSGFWADVGKPRLREKAEKHFLEKSQLAG